MYKPISPQPSRTHPLVRRLAIGVATVLLAVVAAGLWGWLKVRASLPMLEGEIPLAGLSAPVTVERDDLGVPTIRGSSRVDVARATGFVHGQERLFQMDVMRRQAAGELAELFGPSALDWDRDLRRHRLRRVAEKAVERADAEQFVLLEAYTAGVNSGLAQLREPPFEYLVLGVEPDPWQPEDTILAVLAMFVVLHDEDGSGESDLGVLYDVLPEQMADFLSPPGTEWDAPIEGEPMLGAAVPGPEVVDLRQVEALPAVAERMRESWSEEAVVGSNSWAVAGPLTDDGGAILANDMHLGLRVPNTWYRASLVFPDPVGGAEMRITGVTLPGTPAVVVGSNGRVAWGYTNSYGDWVDLVVLEETEDGMYLTPDGPVSFETSTETIEVRGGEAEHIDVVSTVWGPVIDRDHQGRRRALRWTAHDPQAVDLGMTMMETASTVDEALRFAASSGIPPQNFVCADADGRIGWTIMGAIPRRVGFSGRVPVSWADGARRWDGWLEPGLYPRVTDPASHRLWTANARVVGGDALRVIGDGGYALGSRARQIRDDLLAAEHHDTHTLLGIQLDDRALFLARWQTLLMEVFEDDPDRAHPHWNEARDMVESWGARAAIDSVGYRLVRGFRYEVIDRVMEPLTGACREADERFRHRRLGQTEGPVWRLVSERPPHLLDPEYGEWSELLATSFEAVLDALTAEGRQLRERTWGERNTSGISHPMSSSIPLLGGLLNMTPRALPGDGHMPRVQGRTFGASERIVVSPGREADAIMHMPGGQSGHPLSPFFSAGHGAWEQGEPTSFLPGPTIHELRMVPVAGGLR